jgi:hypothetical protein
LLVGGFFRSLQFTSLNAVAYADIEPARMSQATSFAGVAQQLSGSVGIAIAALVLEITRGVKGDITLTAQDFSIAFLVMAVIAGSSALIHRRLAGTAGAELSGHGRTRVAAAAADGVEPTA